VFHTAARFKGERLSMTIIAKTLIGFIFIVLACGATFSQEEGDDNPRANTNLGFPISAHLNPMAPFTNFGMGFTAGAGYNFTRKHGLVGEFMWSHLFLSSSALNPIRFALQDPSVDGSGNLYALTGNYRFELRGKSLGVYFIGGGGLYHRAVSLSHKVTTGSTNITCEPTFEWWGFSCTRGLVTSNQTILRSSLSSLGVNAGIGFTTRVGEEAPYRVYVESRYHYAPTKGISTQMVDITFGIRY